MGPALGTVRGMPPRVLLDASPLTSDHGVRGIGTYVRGLLDGMRALDEADRPELLMSGEVAGLEAFVRHQVELPGWSPRLVPDPRPTRIGERRVTEIAPRLFHATHTGVMPGDVPMVATCHDLIPLRYPALYLQGAHTLQRAPYRRYITHLQMARLVIAPSTATASDLTTLADIPPERVRVIPHGVPADVSPAVPGTKGADYVLCTQSLEPHKNVDLAVKAIAGVRLNHVRLKLAGPWSRRRAARLESLVKRLGVQDRVDLLGYVDAGVLDGLRAGALAVLVPSLVEGFGLPALEAMTAGVPVLASDAPGLMEVTGPELPSFPRLDPEPWSLAIERLATDPAERGRMAAMGMRRAARFSWVTTAKRTVEVYDEALRA